MSAPISNANANKKRRDGSGSSKGQRTSATIFDLPLLKICSLWNLLGHGIQACKIFL